MFMGATVWLTGCASTVPGGAFYADTRMPVMATSNEVSAKRLKVGEASCKSYFGVFSRGDAGIAAAMKKAGITKVYHVDWQMKNIAGLATYTTIVYGE
jgi:hypothetical protein